MPLYEYQCQKCGEVFEVMQKFSDDPISVHETCGGTLERLISAPALQFKGSGWYITDYARSGGKNGKDDSHAKAADSAASKPSDSTTSSTKSDSKPAASCKS